MDGSHGAGAGAKWLTPCPGARSAYNQKRITSASASTSTSTTVPHDRRIERKPFRLHAASRESSRHQETRKESVMRRRGRTLEQVPGNWEEPGIRGGSDLDSNRNRALLDFCTGFWGKSESRGWKYAQFLISSPNSTWFPAMADAAPQYYASHPEVLSRFQPKPRHLEGARRRACSREFR